MYVRHYLEQLNYAEVKMRINDEFKKSGYFWLPSAPDKKIPGILIITDGGIIELELVGVFPKKKVTNVKDASKYNFELPRIIGHIERHGLVTLDYCYYKNTNISSSGISKSVIMVNRAYLGVAYDDQENVSFNTFRFSVEGIDEWIGYKGIQVTYNAKKQTSRISYKPSKNILIKLNNGMKLMITFEWSVPASSSETEAKITQKAYFKLMSKQERPLDDFISVSHKITTLLCFAIDETVCIEQVIATSNTIQSDIGGEEKYPVPIAIYYQSLTHIKKKPQIIWPFMLFTYGHIARDTARIFNNWLNAYDTIAPALKLYFFTKIGVYKYSEGEFLALAQCLETYHRRTSDEKLMDDETYNNLSKSLVNQCPKENREWLSEKLKYGNEINLGRRIKRIIDPYKTLFGTGKNRNSLIRKIVVTRNYLTHYSDDLISEAASGQDLWNLCLNMGAIFQLHLLQILGFSQKKIEAIIKNNIRLQEKINYPRPLPEGAIQITKEETIQNSK